MLSHCLSVWPEEERKARNVIRILSSLSSVWCVLGPIWNCLFVRLSGCPSVRLSACLYVCMYVCMALICLYVPLSVFSMCFLSILAVTFTVLWTTEQSSRIHYVFFSDWLSSLLELRPRLMNQHATLLLSFHISFSCQRSAGLECKRSTCISPSKTQLSGEESFT